jgi:hypothetical protein
MPATLEQYTNNRLQPAQYPQDARWTAGAFGASLTVAAGTCLGKKTSDGLLYAYAQPNVVQTLAITGTLSAGSFRLTVVDKDGKEKVTNAIAYNGANSDIQTALDAITAANAIVVGGTFATANTFTFSGTNYAAKPQGLVAVDISALTGATGATLSETTTLPGTETGVGIAMYDFVTDAVGLCYFGTSTTGSSLNTPMQTMPYFVAGTFDPADLTGYDAAFLADVKGRLLANGFVHIP